MPSRPRGLLLVLLLGGCAAGYSARGFDGSYSERRLDADVFYVSVWGNRHTSRQTVERYAFYHCAELTVQAGYDYFEVVGGNTDARRVFDTAPSSYSSTTPAAATVSGNTALGSPNTLGVYTPGRTIPIQKYEATVLIKLFARPKHPGQGFDARQVLKYLQRRIKKE